MGIRRGRKTSTTTGKGRMAGPAEVDRYRGPVDRSDPTTAALSVGESGAGPPATAGRPRIEAEKSLEAVAGFRDPASRRSQIELRIADVALAHQVPVVPQVAAGGRDPRASDLARGAQVP